MPTLRVIYAAEGKTLRTLLVWRELMREEPDHERLARTWRTSLGQSAVLRGETAAVASPGGRRQSRSFALLQRGASDEFQERSIR